MHSVTVKITVTLVASVKSFSGNISYLFENEKENVSVVEEEEMYWDEV